MRKSLAFCLLTVLVVAVSSANAATKSSDNKVTAGAKKVGHAVTWPFRKCGQGMKAVGKKVRGK